MLLLRQRLSLKQRSRHPSIVHYATENSVGHSPKMALCSCKATWTSPKGRMWKKVMKTMRKSCSTMKTGRSNFEWAVHGCALGKMCPRHHRSFHLLCARLFITGPGFLTLSYSTFLAGGPFAYLGGT